MSDVNCGSGVVQRTVRSGTESSDESVGVFRSTLLLRVFCFFLTKPSLTEVNENVTLLGSKHDDYYILRCECQRCKLLERPATQSLRTFIFHVVHVRNIMPIYIM